MNGPFRPSKKTRGSWSKEKNDSSSFVCSKIIAFFIFSETDVDFLCLEIFCYFLLANPDEFKQDRWVRVGDQERRSLLPEPDSKSGTGFPGGGCRP